MKKTKMSSDQKFVWITVLLGIVAIVSLYFIIGGNNSEKSFTTSTAYSIPIDSDPTIGTPAPIEIVEFGDYRCPACGSFDEVIYPQIKERYIDEGLATFTFKNMPFLSNDSVNAALFGEGVYKILGDEEFYRYHKEIFAHAMDNADEEEIFSIEDLESISIDLFGKNETKNLVEAFKSDEFINELEKNQDEAKEYEVSSTPTIFVNGKRVINPLNIENIDGAIIEAINGEPAE